MNICNNNINININIILTMYIMVMVYNDGCKTDNKLFFSNVL